MWTDPVKSTNWALAWFILSLLAFLFASKIASNPGSQIRERLGKSAWLILPLAALIVRLVPAIILPVGARYDIESFRLAGEAIIAGDDVYTSAAAGRYPYLPFQMYIIGLSFLLSQSSPAPFVVLIKLFPILADVATTVVIWYAARKSGADPRKAWFLSLLFAFNPVSILTTSYHGQFDAITILLLLLGWIFWRFGRKLQGSAIFLGLAILSKTWPVIFLPIVLMRLRRTQHIVLYGLISLSIPIALTVFYTLVLSDDPSVMLRRALTHSGVRGWWGASGLLAMGSSYWTTLAGAGDQLFRLRFFIIAAAAGWALWHTRQQSTLDALVTILLAVFAVTVGMGLQWLVWIVPFAILSRDTGWLRRYSLAAVILLVPHLYGLHLMSWAHDWFTPEAVDLLAKLVALPVWIVIVLWLIDRWRRKDMLTRETVIADQP